MNLVSKLVTVAGLTAALGFAGVGVASAATVTPHTSQTQGPGGGYNGGGNNNGYNGDNNGNNNGNHNGNNNGCTYPFGDYTGYGHNYLSIFPWTDQCQQQDPKGCQTGDQNGGHNYLTGDNNNGNNYGPQGVYDNNGNCGCDNGNNYGQNNYGQNNNRGQDNYGNNSCSCGSNNNNNHNSYGNDQGNKGNKGNKGNQCDPNSGSNGDKGGHSNSGHCSTQTVSMTEQDGVFTTGDAVTPGETLVYQGHDYVVKTVKNSGHGTETVVFDSTSPGLPKTGDQNVNFKTVCVKV